MKIWKYVNIFNKNLIIKCNFIVLNLDWFKITDLVDSFGVSGDPVFGSDAEGTSEIVVMVDLSGNSFDAVGSSFSGLVVVVFSSSKN